MHQYNYLVRPRRPNMIATLTKDEAAVVGEHLEYLRHAHQRGQLIFAGLCPNSAYGIVTFKADSIEEAKAFMLADPLIANNLATAKVQPFEVFYAGGKMQSWLDPKNP